MKYIIGSLVGAVIGYITNWLAIKMLFRPHREIRIGKFRVPFTPGLIPKEKARIARSIGDTIGQHLLTKETIIESLCSEDMNEQLDFWVQNKVSAIENSSATLEDLIKFLLGDRYHGIMVYINDRVSELITGYINGEGVKRAVSSFIKEQIMQELSARPQLLTQSRFYNSIKEKVLNMVVEYQASDKFHAEIEKLLKEKLYELKGLDKSFDEIIPEAITNSLKEYVTSRKEDMAASIKGFMKHEKVRRKLRQIVGEAVGTKLNPMVAIFINADKIYEKALIGIHEFLNNEKNHDDIALAINTLIDGMLKRPVSDIVSELPEEGVDNIINAMIGLIKEKADSGKYITDTYNKLEGEFNNYTSIEDMLERAGIDYKNAIDGFIETRIESVFSSEAFKAKLAEAAAVVIKKLLSLEINTVFKEPDSKLAPSISKMVKDLYNKFINNNVSDVIEVLDVARIVEDKINEFHMDYTEQIILEVASKELRAITWLGALLGAVMGILSPLISSIY